MNLPKTPRKVYALVCLTMALALMVFPYGVAMSFAAGPDAPAVQTYAYFSLTPCGYANFLPLLAGVLTLAAAVLLLFPDRLHMKKPLLLCLGAAVVLSPLSWLIFGSYTGASLAIVVFQLLALLLALIAQPV